MTAFGETAEYIDLYLALCPWPTWIYTSCNYFPRASNTSILSDIKNNNWLYCYAFWEIIFVSNQFFGYFG